MRYEIIDSHRRMSAKRREALNLFFQEVKSIPFEEAQKQVDFCDWYEKEHAVKWFEVVVLDGSKVVGYLRCLRNMEDAREWFIGDVHVSILYRNLHIATRMYEKAIDEVMEYEAAQRIVSSVHPENVKSIGLHEKLGFVNSKRRCEFPTFYFQEEETMFVRTLLHYYPAQNNDECIEALLPLWMDYKKSLGEHLARQEASEELKQLLFAAIEQELYDFEIIWCGNRMVGFTYWNHEEEVEYRKTAKCFENETLR